MSADNWRECPNCSAIKGKEIERLHQKLVSSYGKVPVEQYLLMKDTVDSTEKEELSESLREDWSIGMDTDGLFHVEYRCNCSTCGYSYAHDVSIQTKVPAKPITDRIKK